MIAWIVATDAASAREIFDRDGLDALHLERLVADIEASRQRWRYGFAAAVWQVEVVLADVCRCCGDVVDCHERECRRCGGSGVIEEIITRRDPDRCGDERRRCPDCRCGDIAD